MIALLDYGAGNVGSVLKAVQYLGYGAQPVDRAELLPRATKVILPGQGHFGAMIRALEGRGMVASLRRMIREGIPFLGICLGLQALYETSEEAPGCFGLGLLPGPVKRFEGSFKVPHIGWSQLQIQSREGLFQGVAEGSFVYFCHSYYGPPTKEATAVTEYGQTFAAGVERKKVWAVQFHPEKSGDVGLRVLRNFLGL